jgi:uncharacterized protein YbgA (DUF1722 family)/uncharacterized protein YbbK (DUF523 family)
VDVRVTGDRLRLGISACLLGRRVRYDGGHKRDDFLTEVLANYVDWVPVCPEVESGMGTPRETLRLVRVADDVRLITTRTERDHSAMMRRYAARKLADLDGEDLSGFVLKKDSPSCGLQRVKVVEDGHVDRSGTGLFAAALVARFPLLPVEEEGRLRDAGLREHFIERIFAYRRLTSLFAGRWTIGALVAFHTAHKLSLLAHSPAGYRELGRLVADARKKPRAELRATYMHSFMHALQPIATRGRHANVLRHIAGYLKRPLDDDSRRELADHIDGYEAGQLPLVAPLTLLRHHVRHHGIAYLNGQMYLHPHPAELMLRNHA